MKKTCICILMTIIMLMGVGFSCGAEILSSRSLAVIDADLIQSYSELPSSSTKQLVMVKIEDINVNINELEVDMSEIQASIDSNHSPELRNIYKIKSIIKEFGDLYDEKLFEKVVKEQRDAYKIMYYKKNSRFVERYLDNYDVTYISSHFPIVFVNATYSEVLAISRLNEVKKISCTSNYNDYDDIDNESHEAMVDSYSTNAVKKIIENADAYNSRFLSMTEISYLKDTLNLSGKGVKIGIIEAYTPYKDYWPEYNVVWCSDGSPSEGEHATNVAGVLHLVANDAEIYCAVDSREGSIIIAFDRLLDLDVDIISMSRGSSRIPKYIDECKEIDAAIWREMKNVVIAAGNSSDGCPVGSYVNVYSLSYNTIGVGAVSYNGDIAPFSYYTKFNMKEYPHKPDLCAPGVAYMNYTNSGYMSGTSFSTPLVAGLIALLCQKYPDLKCDPQMTKAIITSAVNSSFSRNVTSTLDDYFERYGAGVLDGRKAYELLNQGQYETGFFQNPQTYEEIDIKTIDLNKGDILRVSMCYDIAIHKTNVVDILSNTIVVLYNAKGTMVAYGSAGNSNVKIFEYEAAYSSKYKISVIHYGNGNSGLYGIDYGVAWICY